MKEFCKHGHVRSPENLNRWGHCRECNRICQRTRRAADPERDREYAHIRYAANRERERERVRIWRADNPERVAYKDAKLRCTNPRVVKWPIYGGRGIEFRFESYEQFFAEIGPRPSPEYSLDRINNDGHYEPGNVRWATAKEQRSNQRPFKRLASQEAVASQAA